MFEHVITAVDNGGRKLPAVTQLGYTKEQADAIQRLKSAKDNYERLGLTQYATKYVIDQKDTAKLLIRMSDKTAKVRILSTVPTSLKILE